MKKALLDSFIWRGFYFVTALLLNVCIARIYEAKQSGWIYFISNNFYFILLLGGLSLDAGVTYFAASNKISYHKLTLFSILWSFVVLVLSVVSTGFLITKNLIQTNILFLLVAGASYTFGTALTNFFTSLFYAKNNYVSPNVFMCSINIIVLLSLPVFLNNLSGFTRDHFLYLYFLQFTIQGVGLALLFINKYSSVKVLQLPGKKEYAALFKFSIIALSANIAYYLINKVDYLFVEAWCSAKSLGNYVQVSKMGQLFLIIPAIISSAVYPQSAKGESVRAERLIIQLISLFVVFYVVISGVSYLIGDKVFTWLFGRTFDEMFIPYLVLLPGILFLSLHIIIAAYFGGKNKTKYNVISTGMGLIVVLAGDFLLIKPMGIVGAALVSTLGYTTAFVCSLVIFINKTGNKWSDLAPWKSLNIKSMSLFFTKPV